MRLRSLWTGGLIVLALGVSATAVARQAPKTLFAQLDEAERRTARAARAVTRQRAQIEANQKRLATTLDEVALTDRATRRIREDAARQHAHWAHVAREVDRSALAALPGQADDTRALLRLAEASVLVAKRQDRDLITALDEGNRRVFELIRGQAQAHVQLAQHRGEEEGGKAERADVKQRAASASARQIDADLRLTEKSLERSLTLVLKNPSREDFHRKLGSLIQPVRTRPDVLYGPRKQARSASYVRHTGYTYMVPEGTSVRAVSDGLVVFASHFEGYGQLVILDHGSGYHTIYAHLSTIKVEVGVSVRRGTTLGESGQTGSLEGPKLYFELRKNGYPIDPSRWFISL